jgi:dihydrofolate reductase
VAGDKHVKLGGASPCKQALYAGLVDEIIIHLAPHLTGGGVRLFDALPDGVRLEKVAVTDGPGATHLLRIPARSGHRFRRDPGADSAVTRALNPEHSGA